MSIDVDKLQAEVRRRYLEATAEDARRHATELVPDFRECDGVQVQKTAAIFIPEAEGLSFEDLADRMVGLAVDFEHGLIEGLGGGPEVSRCFLEKYELPTVFNYIPAHITPDEEDRGKIKFRHVFGVVDRAAQPHKVPA